MYKFSCVYQNHYGFLCVSENDFYFTSSLFRVNLKWSNVKSISLDTKYINNIVTSVLVIKLHRLPVFIQDNAEITKKRRSSQTYIFYGFNDLLGVEENIKHYWKISKNMNQNSFMSIKDGEDSRGFKEEAAPVGRTNNMSSSQVENFQNFAFARPATHNSTLRVPTLTAYPVPDLRPPLSTLKHTPSGRLNTSARDVSERGTRPQARKFTALLYEYGVIILSKPSLLLHILISLLILIVGVQIFVSTGRKPQNSFLDTRHLLEVLEKAKGNYRRSSVHTFIRDRNPTHGDELIPLKDDSTWLKLLDNAVEELLRKYVELQIEMIDLRQRHMERSFSFSHNAESKASFELKRFHATNSTAFFKKEAARVELVPKKPQDAKKPANNFTLTHIEKVFQSWHLPFLINFRIFDLLGTHQGARLTRKEDLQQSRGRVRYVEPFLGDYEIVQYITQEEASERRQCLRISNQLLKVSNLIEELFSRVNSLLFHGSYEDHLFDVGKPQKWSKGGDIDGVHTPYDIKRALLNPHFSTDDALHVIFLWRHADIVQYLNPLESNEYKRREDAAAAARKAVQLKELKVKNLNGLNRSFTDTLSLFSSIITDTSAQLSTSNAEEVINLALGTLRNLFAELQIWDNHKDLWDLHLLTSLTEEQRKQFSQTFKTTRSQAKGAGEHTQRLTSDYLSNLLASVENFSGWRYLPIFKGQLCFSRKPSVCPSTLSRPSQCNATTVLAQSSFLFNSISPISHTQDSFNNFNRGDLPADKVPSQNDGFFPPIRNITFKDACRNIYDLNHVDAAVVIVKERWLDELGAFTALFKADPAGSSHTRHFVYMDDDFYASRELSALSMRLFNIFDRINYWYITPLYQNQSFFKWLSFLSWPFRWLFGGSHKKYVEAADPFIELRKVQITKIPWGNNSDVPFNMIRNFLLHPPALLKAKIQCERKVSIICFSVIIGVAALCAAFFFF